MGVDFFWHGFHGLRGFGFLLLSRDGVRLCFSSAEWGTANLDQ